MSAITEERFTRRKNDVGFPFNSVRHTAGALDEGEFDRIAVIGGSALFARMFPSLEVKRRRRRRKESAKPSVMNMIPFFRVLQAEAQGVWGIAGSSIGRFILKKKLRRLGIDNRIDFVEHHTARMRSRHISRLMKCLLETLDGSGGWASGCR